MEQRITALFSHYLTGFYFPEIRIIDIIEVLILTVLIYKLIIWIKNTKAWTLLRGIAVIFSLILVAVIFQMNTIIFLAKYFLTILATAAIVVFQPELRRALERLGEKNFFTMMSLFEKNKMNTRFSDETREGIITAVYSMAKVKTGALIVMEEFTSLGEYEATGIPLDCIVSSQVLINIFEHNTPLHDGAIIIRGDRIAAATCYLPLSENYSLSKSLGTRHRAAVGLSEVTDALTIVVSEETGAVSIAHEGKISRNLSETELRNRLKMIQNSSTDGENASEQTVQNKLTQIWKGTSKKWKKD